MVLIGVDPGLSGGLAAVRHAANSRLELLDVIDIPTSGEKAKRRVQVLAVMEWVRRFAPDAAIIERAQAMPDQGASSGFHYGRAVGALETCIDGLLIPLTVIESTAWKKYHGLLKREKEDSRQRALRIFPEAHALLARKMDHNRAEAALIAAYGCALAAAGYNRENFDAVHNHGAAG